MKRPQDKTAKPGPVELGEKELGEVAGGTIVAVNGGGNTPNGSESDDVPIEAISLNFAPAPSRTR